MASACSRPPANKEGITIIGAKIVQMMGGSGPTAARIAASAASCSPSAPRRGSTGWSRVTSAAPASGVCVTVNGVARSVDGRYLSPHISAKHCARDWGFRKSQSNVRASRSVSAASPAAEFSVTKLCSQKLSGTRSTRSPPRAASTRARLVMAMDTSLQRVGVDRRADRALHGQRRRHQQKGVAPVGGAVGGQLLEEEDLAERQPHVRDGHDVERIAKGRELGGPHLDRVVVAGHRRDLPVVYPRGGMHGHTGE